MSSSRLAIFIGESCLSLVTLVIFSLTYAGDYRMKAWLNGGGEGWNSDPAQRVYFYANFKEPPDIPIIWTQDLSRATLGIAILTQIWLLVHAVASRHGYLAVSATLACDTFLALLWIYITREQCSGDLTDEQHMSQYPWFLTHACSGAWDDVFAACHALRAGFYMSLATIGMFCGRVSLSIRALSSCSRPGEYKYGKLDTVSGRHVGTVEGGNEEWELGSLDDPQEEELRKALREAISPVLAFFPASHA